MKNVYKKHVFVCENIRYSSKRKSCGRIGKGIRSILKKKVHDNNLKNTVRINRSGCLDHCEDGPCLVIYPEGKWYTEINEKDCDDIFLNSIFEEV